MKNKELRSLKVIFMVEKNQEKKVGCIKKAKKVENPNLISRKAESH